MGVRCSLRRLCGSHSFPPGTVHFSLHPDDGQALRRPEEDATTGGLIDEEGSLVCGGGAEVGCLKAYGPSSSSSVTVASSPEASRRGVRPSKAWNVNRWTPWALGVITTTGCLDSPGRTF